MNQLRYITDDDILKTISPAEAINVTKQAFIDYAKQKSKMPEKIYLDMVEFNGDFRAMPAYVERYNIAGIKWVNSHKDNPKQGLPSVMASLIVNNPKTGELIALLDATALTCLRTGSVGAIATELLCKKKTPKITLIGCGKQAEFQIKCIQEISTIESITCYDVVTDNAQALAKKVAAYTNQVMISSSIKEACNLADIIITTTPAKAPCLNNYDIPQSCLIIAIGADAKGKQELNHDILKNATIIVDDIKQASHSGELNTAISEKKLSEHAIDATLGDMLVGNTHLTLKDHILVDSTGLAIQDLALAGYYLQK
tara:strand:+ start:4396 stop:5334 length:939 start_codon:yes stop_codon:yes gene_type:complete